jgi:2-polyprenyl-6-methoxyphenol hydroxylase-like FAD-dependent oxidoreductase
MKKEMQAERFDVVVIGGGPAGSSAAAFLARGGLEVLALERETFPRFHIGESLLPAGWDLWEKIGAREALEAARFTVKQGVMFGMFGAEEDVTLLTAEFPEFFPRPWTYHVERAEFDQILLDNAKKQGAEVRTGWTCSSKASARSACSPAPMAVLRAARRSRSTPRWSSTPPGATACSRASSAGASPTRRSPRSRTSRTSRAASAATRATW